MARRPDLRKPGSGWSEPGNDGLGNRNSHRRGAENDQIMSPDDLKQLRTSLSRLSVDAVRHAYHTAYARCRMVNDRVPSAHSIQELVQVWKQLWKWR